MEIFLANLNQFLLGAFLATVFFMIILALLALVREPEELYVPGCHYRGRHRCRSCGRTYCSY